MKKVIVLIVFCGVALPLTAAALYQTDVIPVMLASPQHRWSELGTITASNSYPAVGDRDYTTVDALPDANVVEWDVPNWARKAMMSFETTANADSTTVVFLAFADSKQYTTADALTLDDDALYGGQLVLTGGQQVGSHSNVCVDTIVATDGVFTFAVYDSGNDRRCTVEFNTKGFKKITIIATSLHAASTLYVEGRFFQ